MRKFKVCSIGNGFFVTERIVKPGFTVFGVKLLAGIHSVTVWRNADGRGMTWKNDDGEEPNRKTLELLNQAVRRYLGGDETEA